MSYRYNDLFSWKTLTLGIIAVVGGIVFGIVYTARPAVETIDEKFNQQKLVLK